MFQSLISFQPISDFYKTFLFCHYLLGDSPYVSLTFLLNMFFSVTLMAPKCTLKRIIAWQPVCSLQVLLPSHVITDCSQLLYSLDFFFIGKHLSDIP